ncbi:MAG: hypothetical protein R6V41_10905 [Desulfobacteraceae bacterium]
MTSQRFKPAAGKRILVFLAGFVWICAGTVLLSFSAVWLDGFFANGSLKFTGAGAFLALVIHHFGFLKVVNKNLGRLLPLDEPKCIFSFISWKSYIIIAVMVFLGVLLRHSPIPKPLLSVLYTGIGLALILSSIRYLRICMKE